jgi:hypothetical protein
MNAADTRKQMAELLAATIPAGPSQLFGGLQNRDPGSTPAATFEHNDDEVVARAEEQAPRPGIGRPAGKP